MFQNVIAYLELNLTQYTKKQNLYFVPPKFQGVFDSCIHMPSNTELSIQLLPLPLHSCGPATLVAGTERGRPGLDDDRGVPPGQSPHGLRFRRPSEKQAGSYLNGDLNWDFAYVIRCYDDPLDFSLTRLPTFCSVFWD